MRERRRAGIRWVKTVPLDVDRGFALAADILDLPHESDVALWKRMESTACFPVFSSSLRDG